MIEQLFAVEAALLGRVEEGTVDLANRRQLTGGRRIEASHLLGMGRNTLTRKIQELNLVEAAKDK